MHLSTLLSLASMTLVMATQPYYRSTRTHQGNYGGILRRETLTCEETYGEGSVTCGVPGSKYCYNPGKGEECCPDSGYCDEGSFCAPVNGFCCLDGETHQICANNAGFTLPEGYLDPLETTIPSPPLVSSVTTTVAVPTISSGGNGDSGVADDASGGGGATIGSDEDGTPCPVCMDKGSPDAIATTTTTTMAVPSIAAVGAQAGGSETTEYPQVSAAAAITTTRILGTLITALAVALML